MRAGLSLLALLLVGCAHAGATPSDTLPPRNDEVAVAPRLDRMLRWAPRSTPHVVAIDLERARALPSGYLVVRELASGDPSAEALYERTRTVLYGIGPASDGASVEVAGAVLDPADPPPSLVETLAAESPDGDGIRRIDTETFSLLLTPERFFLIVPRPLSGDADILPERRTTPIPSAVSRLRAILGGNGGAPIVVFVLLPAAGSEPMSYVLREAPGGVVIELEMPLSSEDASTWDAPRKRELAEGMVEGLRRIDARAFLLERFVDRVAVEAVPGGVVARMPLSSSELEAIFEAARAHGASLEGRLAEALPDVVRANASGDPAPGIALRIRIGDAGPEGLPASRVGLDAAVQIALAERPLGFDDDALAFARRARAIAVELEGGEGALAVGPTILEGVLLDELGAHAEAAERLGAAIALCSAHPSCRDRPAAERARALALAGAGDAHALDALPLPSLAAGQLGDAAAVRALDDRARALDRLGRDAEALPLARQAAALAARLDPQGASRARNAVERTYGVVALSADQLEESLTVLESAYARLDADDSVTRLELGLPLCRARTLASRHDEAIALCLGLVELANASHGPTHQAEAHLRLAGALAASGDREAARAEAEAALALYRELSHAPTERVAEAEALLAPPSPTRGRRRR